MARTCPIVRDATAADAQALLSIWQDFTTQPPRRPRSEVDEPSIGLAVDKITSDPDQRLLLALVDDEPVGVAHVRVAPLSPIHLDSVVHVGYLHVLSGFRRRGLGRLLLDTAAEWAEEVGSPHIVALVAANARDSNRFLTRLGMSQMAVVRTSTVAALRARLRSADRDVAPSRLVSARRLRRLSASHGPAGR